MCRTKAARFRERARESHDPLIGEMLMELAREWEARAETLERDASARPPKQPPGPSSGTGPRGGVARPLREGG